LCSSLVEILKHRPGPQMSYQVGFCLWLLSFEARVSEKINKQVNVGAVSYCIELTIIARTYDIIPLLKNVAEEAKEKVVRVILATYRVLLGALKHLHPTDLCFQNLVTIAPKQNLPAMLVAEVLPFVKFLGGPTRKWTDEDVVEDIQFLKDELTAKFQSLTSVQHLRIPVESTDGVTGHGKNTQLNLLLGIFPGLPYTSQTSSGRRTQRN
jgi:V-type H+-transporting ATPase subunit H